MGNQIYSERRCSNREDMAWAFRSRQPMTNPPAAAAKGFGRIVLLASRFVRQRVLLGGLKRFQFKVHVERGPVEMAPMQ